MCGIMGYIGNKQAVGVIMEGLRRESYRGYDSSGLVVFGGADIHYYKSVGKLEKLAEKINGKPILGTMGLGHNRWATHGGVTEVNAHPHVDCQHNIFVTHNGIIENHQALREALEKEGHVFASQTDTEAIAHLIEHFFTGDLGQAVSKALPHLKGAYGIAVIAKKDPGKIVAARLSAPLVVSVNRAGGFVASDPTAIISHSKDMVFLDDGEMAVVTKDSLVVTDLQSRVKEKLTTTLPWNINEATKDEHQHFMVKEIFQHPESLASALAGRLLIKEGRAKLGGLEDSKSVLAKMDKVQIIACGGSSYAARVAKYMFEEYANMQTGVDVGSEFRYRKPVFDKKTLYLFISQSGETADTLAALAEVKAKGGLTMAIVNVVGSTLAREAGLGVYTHSGPEIAVASTKTFTAQLAVLSLLALFLGRSRQLPLATGRKIAKGLSGIPKLAGRVLENKNVIEEVAKKYAGFDNFCVIGRKYNYPIALEGALKLKEVAYVHGEGIEGGELKHGYLSLIGPDFPTIAIVPSDSVYDKMVSNIQQIKARGGLVIAIATEGDTQIKKIADEVIYIPKTLEMLTPILSTISLHLLAYYIAKERGCPIDQPRNLAKSVTVE